jgi:agmatine deiminase
VAKKVSAVAPLAKAPARLGYRMPAEWEPHAATWLAWPHNKADWPGKFAPIPWVYAEIVRQLAKGEVVRILVGDDKLRAGAERILKQAGADLTQIDFVRQPTDRVWTRDSGAIFVTDGKGKRAATTWRFNAWAKYPDWKRDVKIPATMAKVAGVPTWQPVAAGGAAAKAAAPVVMEGGAIDVDGEGTLLATEECLQSPVQERNPGLDKAAYQAVFADALGITKVLWLAHGIVGDDTHGHIDDLCRFVGPGRLVLATEQDPRDANYRLLAENHERLQGARDAKGRKLEVIDLPMPAPLVFSGQRIPASYANFYIANGRVLVPTFNDPQDRIALGILAECFPGREIVGIHAVDLVWGLGTLHCMTQQEPA